MQDDWVVKFREAFINAVNLEIYNYTDYFTYREVAGIRHSILGNLWETRYPEKALTKLSETSFTNFLLREATKAYDEIYSWILSH